MRALSFLADPVEVFASITTIQIIGITVAVVMLFIAMRYLFLKVADPFPITTEKFAVRFSGFVAGVILIVYCLRGGLQLIPINESSCYFSEKIEENHAAINPSWYLMRNIQLANRAGDNSYLFYTEADAEAKFNALIKTKRDTTTFLTSQNPNIVFLILESHTADVIGALGGDSDNSPQLDAIIKNDAFTFTQCYASGFRTDQMLPSVFSGFPAQPNNSIIRHNDKIQQLPHLPLVFKKAGYSTSFYYAGEMEFANMKSYLFNTGFDMLVDKSAYTPEQLNSKWGSHDQYAFDKFLTGLNVAKQPFFSGMLTITLHEPFEIPATPKYAGTTEAIKFKNAAYYTDSCIGDFFAKAKKQSWYSNTLFVIVADHGHHLPKERSYYDPYTHRIPLLFCGGALKPEFHGKLFNRVTSQHDLPAILLGQFQQDAAAFIFSKNTLNPDSKAFAYLCYDDGFSWVTDSCSLHYSLAQNKADEIKCNNTAQEKSNIENGKAYLQKLYQEFLKN
jgi:phosphoglycerol transferase MdoB-like AlkP superfamily enzyme